MSKDFWFALGLASLSIIVVVFQMIYPTIPPQVGWSIITALSVGAGYCVFRGIREKGQKDEIAVEALSRKEQTIAKAQSIHSRMIELDNRLEQTKRKLSKDEKWQQSPEVKEILDKLQTGLNDLGYLINNRDYDRWAEALMRKYSYELTFHHKADGLMDEWSRARINAKFRDYIKKIKG